MKQKYKIAIFDMDGTILNTLEDLADSVNYCLRKFGLPERSVKEIRSFLGNGIARTVERSVPEGTDAELTSQVLDMVKAYYLDHSAIKTCAYDGIPELLLQLKNRGIKTAVVSNKTDAVVSELCVKYFNGLFDYSVGDKPGQRIKPYPDSVYAVLDHFNLSKEDALYIGDSEVDFQTACNAGIDSVNVSWGFRDTDYLLSIGVKHIVNSPNEILDYFVSG